MGSSQISDISVKSVVADFVPSGKGGYGDVKGLLDDDPRNGWTTKGAPEIAPHYAVFALAEPLVLASDEEMIVELRQRSTLGDANIGAFGFSYRPAWTSGNRSRVAPLEELSQVSTVDRKMKGRLFEQFLADREVYQISKRSLDRAIAVERGRGGEESKRNGTC